MEFATCKWIVRKPDCKYVCQCTRGDLESFMMLFFDNFSSLLGILGAMVGTPLIACSFDFTYFPYFQAYRDMVFQRVCPGIGCALLFGNMWYAWAAARLAAKEGRKDVTALPYGINTPAGFITVFAVMLPVAFGYSPKVMDGLGLPSVPPGDFAWHCFTVGCAANFCGGLFEIAGIFLGNLVRRNFPRAALFGPICGVGFVWLGFNPLIDCMREPIIGFIPLFLCFTGFFANGGKGIYGMVPTALVIFVVGTVLWWCGLARWDTETRVDSDGDLNEVDKMRAVLEYAGENYPGKNKWSPFVCVGDGFSNPYFKIRMIAIQFPIALASFLETIENVEAAALEGDKYNVYEAMLADGMGTCFGALTGAVMPTTVYIGHRRHKAVGATCMYSILNGLVYFILMMSGLTGVLFYLIDGVSIGVILIAVGLMIVQQSLEHTAPRHYPCLMIAIMPALSDMIYFDMFNFEVNQVTRSLGRQQGVANMAPGSGIMVSLVLPAILCDLIDSRFIRASFWCFLAMWLSLFGLMHGNNYVWSNGQELHPHGTLMGGGDLGEVMLSTETYATNCNAPGDDTTCPCGFDPAIGGCTWQIVYGSEADGYAPNTYHINHFEAMSVGFRVPTLRSTGYNEGWRFAVAYAILFVVCLGHAGVQATLCKGKEMCAAVMDNGYAEGSPSTDTAAPAKGETAEA